MKGLLSSVYSFTLGGLTSLSLMSLDRDYKTCRCTTKSSPGINNDLKTYTLQDVSEHNTDDTGYWVCFGNGVYDVTNFIKRHANGNYYIKSASGGRLEPFWKIYSNHLQDSRVAQTLETLRIGNLAEQDQIKMPDRDFDYFEGQPSRDNENIAPFDVMGTIPFNAETKTSLLGRSLITPNNQFFVRNHFPIPTGDVMEHELHIHLSG